MMLHTLMELSVFLAALAFILLVICIIPLILLVLKRLEGLQSSAEDLKEHVKLLLQDSRAMVQSVNELSQRANQQIADVSHVVHTFKKWTDKTEFLVGEVVAIIEPPLALLSTKARMIGLGVSTVLKLFLNHRANKKSQN